MATMRKPNALAEVSIEPSELSAALEPAVAETPSSELMQKAPVSRPRKSPVEEIESFFDLAIDELISLRTRAEADAIERAADVLLYAGVDNEGGTLNIVPRASILAKVYVLCALSVALEAHKNLTREQYARWHPGGALGRLARGE